MIWHRPVRILVPLVVVLIIVAAALALGRTSDSSSPGTTAVAGGAGQPGTTTSSAGGQPGTTATTTPVTSGTTDASAGSTTTGSSSKVVDVDVLIYGTQTSGLAALHELEVISPALKVALVSGEDALESPLAEGLCVEDRYPATPLMGFYKEWRDGVIAEYQAEGKKVLAPGGRLSYEPEIAKQVLSSLIHGGGSQPLTIVGQLVSATDKGDTRYAVVRSENGGLVRVNTKYFIDASVEADLARKLGADYRVGSAETIYNDVAHRVPAPPSAANGFVTAPQKMATLLTLQVFPNGPAPPISALKDPDYDPSTYDPAAMNATGLAARFATSWTMQVGVLPGSKRELNEAWNDWPDDQVAFAWVFHPQERKAIYGRVLTRSLNFVRYLQDHGYPDIGLDQVPDLPYVREGPRVVGIDTYTSVEVVDGTSNQSIALGFYALFDRHQNVSPTHHNVPTTFMDTPTMVHVPMRAIMAAGHPWLLVTTAISADYKAYCSAVRMEPTRANIGGAAGVIMALAAARGIPPTQLTYADVRPQLTDHGYAVN